jgi:voltage-gated potassium channel
MHQGRRLGVALAVLTAVVVFGTVGYLLLGFAWLDALYQTVTTVSTVGFREVEPLSASGQVFTMVLIFVGVGATLYALAAIVELIVEGRLNELLGRRRMEQSIAALSGHVIICGWGRVGRAIAADVHAAKRRYVVVDIDSERLAGEAADAVVGDATEDTVLQAAGIERASALIAAVDSDAANSFIVLSARALRSDLFIVARTRSQDSQEKLLRAGADRVVNPQSIGGARMAAFVLQPHVAEFLDVVMHERTLELRLEEVSVSAGSPLAGSTIGQSALREQTGALVLALRGEDGSFRTNPRSDTRIDPGEVLIAIGTQAELDALVELAGG